MAERNSTVIEAPADRALTLTRVFSAPRRLVFEAFTKKVHLDRWMCPHGFTIPSSGGDVRVGGEWYCLMISPRGERCHVSGIYEKVVPDELLVFTHAWKNDEGRPEHATTVTVHFEDAGAGKTRMTVEHSVFRSVESRDVHMAGWTESLEKLSELLEQVRL